MSKAHAFNFYYFFCAKFLVKKGANPNLTYSLACAKRVPEAVKRAALVGFGAMPHGFVLFTLK